MGRIFFFWGCWGFSEKEDFVLFFHGGEASRAEPLADVTDTKSLGTGRGDLRRSRVGFFFLGAPVGFGDNLLFLFPISNSRSLLFLDTLIH